MTSRRKLLATTASALAVGVAGCNGDPAPQSGTCPTGQDSPTCDPNATNDSENGSEDDLELPARVTALEAAVHTEVNVTREEYGCDPLDHRSDVRQVARAHSQDMRDRDFFDHTNPDGESPHARISDAVDCGSTGENIAWNTEAGIEAAAKATVNQWMDSEGHRENILRKKWTAQGIGVALTSDGRVYYTQNFVADC